MAGSAGAVATRGATGSPRLETICDGRLILVREEVLSDRPTLRKLLRKNEKELTDREFAFKRLSIGRTRVRRRVRIEHVGELVIGPREIWARDEDGRSLGWWARGDAPWVEGEEVEIEGTIDSVWGVGKADIRLVRVRRLTG